jgi:hypothetical protein
MAFSSTTDTVVFVTTLAEYQTRFWLPVAEERRRRGAETRFLSFDDRSTEILRTAGFRVDACAPAQLAREADDADIVRLTERFGLARLNHWVAHERITFGLRDRRGMLRRLRAYVELADQAFVEARASCGRVVLVQELGGFMSVIAAYHAARANGIDNWFIEPAFFRGRLFLVRNSFEAISIPAHLPIEVSTEVGRYLDATLAAHAIVIPQKDRHQYTSAFRKILNMRNARRLIEKTLDKHLRGKHQEFGHIGRHVATHLGMLKNSLRLRTRYTALGAVTRFVYYPLHVPADMALTLRSPAHLDQLALVDYIARSVPATHTVAIKEHPAMIGALPADRLLTLLRRYDNVALLPPSTNNFRVLAAADAVVSVNSKSGAEALMLGKRVLVLGDAFYRDSPLVTHVERLQDLPSLIEQSLRVPSRAADPALVKRYFEAVWRCSVPGELYVDTPENVTAFVDGIESVIVAGAIEERPRGAARG